MPVGAFLFPEGKCERGHNALAKISGVQGSHLFFLHFHCRIDKLFEHALCSDKLPWPSRKQNSICTMKRCDPANPFPRRIPGDQSEAGGHIARARGSRRGMVWIRVVAGGSQRSEGLGETIDRIAAK